MKTVRDEWKCRLLCALLTLCFLSIAKASDQNETHADDEALFEFLGALDDDADEWNEFFDLAAEGLPPELEEDDNE